MTAVTTMSYTRARNPLAGGDRTSISRPDWTVRGGLTVRIARCSTDPPLEFRPKSKRDRKR